MCSTCYGFKNHHLKKDKFKSALLQNYSLGPRQWCLTAMKLRAFPNIVILSVSNELFTNVTLGHKSAVNPHADKWNAAELLSSQGREGPFVH